MKKGHHVIFAVSYSLVVVLGQTCNTQAQKPPAVANFYGETNEDVTSVTPVPAGMSCASGGVNGKLTVDNGGLTVQTSEPPEGFSGACLMNRAYGGGLPSVCYSPLSGVAKYTIRDLNPTTSCSIPAANAVQPDWAINVDQGARAVTRQPAARPRTMETCVPHLGHIDEKCNAATGYYGANDDIPNGDCPCGTKLVSHSCCTQIGAAMQSDGQTAMGNVYFTSSF
jgi:hypothetical protein